METTLHRQLKDEFCDPGAQLEVPLGAYRIDVVNGERLVEIQRSGLAAIRDKIQALLRQGHLVDVVKPLVIRKRLVKLDAAEGRVVERRWSPKRGSILDVFDELVYFTRVFPHPHLTLITPLIEIEEIRYPGRGRRRRRREGQFVVQDRQILEMGEAPFFRRVQDLQSLLPSGLAREFDTRELAEGLAIDRSQAQRIAYVMRQTGAAKVVGKRGNANLYRLVSPREADRALAARKPRRRARLQSAAAVRAATR